MPRCTVIVPTLDERENLPVLVRQLMALPDLDVLVVDDASSDGTGEIAEQLGVEFPGRVRVLHRPGRRGLGSAYIEGFQLLDAAGSDAELIVQMDADLSHDVRHLPAMIARAAAADLVVGSRYVSGGRIENWALQRRLLSRFANAYVRVIAGVRVRDSTTGYRCWRRQALARVLRADISSNGYAFLVEMAWYATRLGLRMAEVPIVFVERREGQSKMSWKVVRESIVLPWKLRRRTDVHL